MLFIHIMLQDPFYKDKDHEAELILDDEEFMLQPRVAVQKRLRGSLELCRALVAWLFDPFWAIVRPLKALIVA